MKKIFLLLTILFFLLLYSCKETPVQNEQINAEVFTAPVLISPYNNTTITIYTPDLDWNDITNAVIFQIVISSDANFLTNIVLDTNVTSSVLTVPQGRLTTNIFYYWKVRAMTSSDTSAWSSLWRFNIILTPPPPPTLISPPDNAVNIPFLPLFEWNMIPEAQNYRIQISLLNNFSNVLIDSSRILINSFQTPLFFLTTGTQYFWRVNASNSNGVSTSQWSQVFNFTTINGAHPNSISGRITFADTNILSDFAYYVNSYTQWFPYNTPFARDTLEIQRSGNVYYADYRIDRLPDDDYYISVTYVWSDIMIHIYTMGIYGCDTNHTQYSQCPNNPPGVIISGNNGVENINFLSWADTSRKIFGN